MKLAKNQPNAEQDREAELLDIVKILNILKISKENKRKNKYVCIREIIWLTLMVMKMKMKNRSQYIRHKLT